jgi:predicted dehydrogenase
MSQKDQITRKEFLYKAGMMGTAAALTSILGMAKTFAQDNKKIKVAVIGCGSVTRMYFPHLSQSPYVELVSASDIIPERAAQAAAEFKIPHHYASIEELLEGAPFDLLVNTTDMQEHGRLNKMAILAGKHVWSEKPLANTYREGKELVDLAQRSGIRIWGAPAVVNSPQFEFMSRAIQSGKIGKVAASHAHYGHLGPGWSAFFYEKMGGSLPDLAVYNIATIVGLLGPAVSVVAMLNIITPMRKVDNRPDPIKVEAEDNASLLLEHESGAISHIQSGFNYFDPYGHHGSGQDKPTISIWGTKGNMHLIGYDWAPFGVDMANEEQDEKIIRYVEDTGTYVWEEGASVIAESLAEGTEPRINVAHSLHVLEIIEAARKSEKSRKRISLKSKFTWPILS